MTDTILPTPTGEPISGDTIVIDIGDAYDFSKVKVAVATVTSMPKRIWNKVVSTFKSAYHAFRSFCSYVNRKYHDKGVRATVWDFSILGVKYIGSAIAFAAWLFVVYFIFIWAFIAALSLFDVE